METNIQREKEYIHSQDSDAFHFLLSNDYNHANRVDVRYPYLLRNSVFISIYSLLEDSLMRICNYFKEKHFIQEKIIKSERLPVINHAKNFVENILGGLVPNDEWLMLSEYRHIRNSIVHDRGYLFKNSRSLNKNILEAVNTLTDKGIRIKNQSVIELNEIACVKFIESVESFFLSYVSHFLFLTNQKGKYKVEGAGKNMSKNKVMKKSVFDEFQIKGYWWLPYSEEKIAGILFYKKDFIKLEIIGTLNKGRVSGFMNSDEVDLILGVSDIGEEFTLLNCYSSNFSINSPGFMTETYTVNSFLVGGHFKTSSEINFHSLAFYPTYFSKWTQKFPYSEEYLVNNDGHLEKIRSINFKEPIMFKEYVQSLNAKIEETYITNFTGDRNDSIHWSYKGGIKVLPDEWKNFDWFFKTMFKLKELYTLLLGYPTYFESIIFYGEEEKLDNLTYRKKYSYFLIQKNAKIRTKFNSHDSMVNFRDISDKLSNVFNFWFEKQEILKTIVDLYLSDFYMDMYLETKFLNSIQTLEIYHRKVYNGKLFDPVKYQKYSTDIVNFVNDNIPEFVERIKGMLLFGNELSLSKRLKELINSLSPDTKTYIIGKSDNRKKFIQQLVDTRNYLTHYDVGDKKNVLKDSSEIFYAIQRLKALATLFLFKEIGIEENVIINKIQQSKQYSYSIEEAKKLLN